MILALKIIMWVCLLVSHGMMTATFIIEAMGYPVILYELSPIILTFELVVCFISWILLFVYSIEKIREVKRMTTEDEMEKAEWKRILSEQGIDYVNEEGERKEGQIAMMP